MRTFLTSLDNPLSHAVPTRAVRRVRWLASGLVASLLAACGLGIDLAGGVGSGGSGLVEGTITGFGSVIVDGVPYDDSVAQAQVRGEDDRLDHTTLLLGQRVRLVLDDPRKAREIEVLPQLRGPVTLVQSGDGLQVAGQWVRVDADTVFVDGAGRTALATVGAELEVHGHWLQDEVRGTMLAATLVLAVGAVPADAPMLVGGVVHAVDGRIVTLGLDGGTRLSIPQEQSLPPVGEVVAAWVSRGALADGDPWPVRRQRQAPSGVEGTTLVVGGPVQSSKVGSVRVQGLELEWPGGLAALEPLPQRGDFVQLTLRRVSGRWEVQAVERRDSPQKLGGRVVLRARSSGIDWLQQPLELTLRGVRVVVPGDVSAASNCAAFGTAAVDVEVVATPGPLPIGALAVQCSAPAFPGNSGNAGSTASGAARP
jgi:hypothetical protein